MQPGLQVSIAAFVLISLLSIREVRNDYCVFEDIIKKALLEKLPSSVIQAAKPFNRKIKASFKDVVKLNNLQCDKTDNALKSFDVDVTFTTDQKCQTEAGGQKREHVFDVHFIVPLARSDPSKPFAISGRREVNCGDALPTERACDDILSKLRSLVVKLKFDKADVFDKLAGPWVANGFKDEADVRKLSDSTTDEKQKQFADRIRKTLTQPMQLPSSSKDAARKSFHSETCTSDECFDCAWRMVDGARLTVGVPEDKWQIRYGKDKDGTGLIAAYTTAPATVCFRTTETECPGDGRYDGSYAGQCSLWIGVKAPKDKTVAPQVDLEQLSCKFGQVFSGGLPHSCADQATANFVLMQRFSTMLKAALEK